MSSTRDERSRSPSPHDYSDMKRHQRLRSEPPPHNSDKEKYRSSRSPSPEKHERGKQEKGHETSDEEGEVKLYTSSDEE